MAWGFWKVGACRPKHVCCADDPPDARQVLLERASQFFDSARYQATHDPSTATPTDASQDFSSPLLGPDQEAAVSGSALLGNQVNPASMSSAAIESDCLSLVPPHDLFVTPHDLFLPARPQPAAISEP